MVLKAYVFLGPLAAAVGLFGFFYRYLEAGWHFGDWAGMAAFGQAPVGAHPATGIYMAATTLTLTGIVMAQVGNGFAMRTLRQSIVKIGFFTNPMLMWGIAAEIGFQAALVYFKPLQAIFSTASMNGMEWLVLAAFAPLLLVADEIRKYVLRRFWNKPDIQLGQAPVPAPDTVKAG
jgi:magnesium-transporting ATPase (P-type)